tara:strand:+ start:3116 stop:3778 length:663 start_codon:yes stop_codon:yes gene_type:complete
MTKINFFPIHWFGDRPSYEASSLRVVTVGLNPSDREFRPNDATAISKDFRFPDFDGTDKGLALALNNYFKHKPYNAWFKGSFAAVLQSFEASFYEEAKNTAIHTDICSPWATIPTWSKLPEKIRQELEIEGHELWKKLILELQPDVILFSSSPNHEQKIDFPSLDKEWKSVDVGAKRMLLVRRFQINGKITQVLFQVQGRKPFLQTSRMQKLMFNQHIIK